MYGHNSIWLLPGLLVCGLFGTSSLCGQEPVVISQTSGVQDAVVLSDQRINESPIVRRPIAGSPIVKHVVDPVPTTSPEPRQPTVINWIHKYGTARRTGTKKQKPVMLFLTMDGCLHCRRMDHTVFSDSRIATGLNQKFVPARLKLERTSQLAQDLKVTVFPTTVFIAPDGKILDYVRGYLPSQKFRHHMDQVSKNQTASLRMPAK